MVFYLAEDKSIFISQADISKFQMAKAAISAALSKDARRELERLQERIRVIDLPTHPDFGDAYTEGMFTQTQLYIADTL